MTAVAWVICIATAIVLVAVYVVADARGYAAGRRDERRVFGSAMNEAKRQGLAAQRDIDYLYERASWQIARQSPSAGRPGE